MQTYKRSDALAYLPVLAILLLPTIGLVTFATTDQLIRLFPDDAFYYLQTAFNAVHLGRISFDGLSETNGFHPLQFLVSVLLAKISDKSALLRWVVIENAFLVLVTSVVLVGYFFRDCTRVARILAIVVLSSPIWYLYIWLDAGMEMGPVLLFGALFYCAWDAAADNAFISLRENCWFAACAALLILARLDVSIPLALFALVYLAFAIRKRLSVRYIVIPAVVAAMLLLPYVAWNWSKFGHLVPVSGVVKAGAAHDVKSNWRALSSGSHIGGVLVVLPLLSAVAALWLRAVPQRLRSSFWLLIASTGIYYAYVLFYAQQVFRWYLAYPLVLQSVSIALLLRELLRAEKLVSAFCNFRMVVGCVLLSAGLHTVLYIWASHVDTTSLYLKQVAEDLNLRLNRNDIVATYDAGIIGYFSTARVVNLDGLANSYEYYESYLKQNRVGAYLKEIDATYYLAREEAGRDLPFESDNMVDLVASYRIPRQFDLSLYHIK